MIGYARGAFLSLGLACVIAVTPAAGQAPQAGAPAAKAGPDRSQAYYAFAMAHLYAELAQAYGNRGEYVNKAIDMYRQAMQLDRATQLANELIKANPNNANAHKILARVYMGQIGDPERGKIDTAMLKSALEEYKNITRIDPKDTESLSNLARLYVVSHDSNGAEQAYKAVLAIDPNDDDALTGLASVYADRGDLANAIATLKQAAEDNPDATRVTTLAELYEQDKQFSKAADAWKEALPLTNDNKEVRKHYAMMLEASNRTDELLKAVQDLAVDDPQNADYQLEIAGIYQHKHDYANAEIALAKAEAIDKSPRVGLAKAELLAAEGKPQDAIAIVQGVLDQTKRTQYTDQDRKDRVNILTALAQFQKDAGKTQDAVVTLRQISDLEPAAASEVEIRVIALLLGAKDLKGARQAADAALRKFPNDRGVIVEHASLLSELGEYDAAIKEIRSLPDAAKDQKMLLFIAGVQEKAKRYADESKTLDTLEGLSTSEPEKSTVYFQRGAMFERQKNYEASEQQFRKAIAADPKNAQAMNYLGYTFADRGVRLEEAQQLISKALDLDPDNGAFLDSLGWVDFRLNHLDQAAEELRKALSSDATEGDPTVHDHLGEVYFKQGKIKEAVQQWEAAVAGFRNALPSEQDPEELAKVTKKLESAKVKVAEIK